MRRFGTVSEVAELEKIIRGAGCYSVLHDGGDAKGGLFGSDGKSAAYSRLLEVYLDSRAVEWLKQGDILELFDIAHCYVRFGYDYREDKANVKLSKRYVSEVDMMAPGFKTKFESLQGEVEIFAKEFGWQLR